VSGRWQSKEVMCRSSERYSFRVNKGGGRAISLQTSRHTGAQGQTSPPAEWGGGGAESQVYILMAPLPARVAVVHTRIH
jgi:hypothetical protein